MSHRKLNIDPLQKRREAYRKLDTDKAQEAVWEALDELAKSGANLGDKAAQVLADREDIKRKFPKK